MRRFSLQTIREFVPEETRAYQCACVYPSVFTPRQCGKIVEQAANFAADPGYVGSAPGDAQHDEEIRRSRVSWIPNEDRFAWIHDKLAAVVRRANRVYDFDLLGFTEDLQFAEYESAGAFYTWHQDGLDGELAVRKLSLVVQLSDPDDYEGGDLEFFSLEDDEADAGERRAEIRTQGTVVVFPAFEHHRVTPLVSGRRQSLVCWVGGPPFR